MLYKTTEILKSKLQVSVILLLAATQLSYGNVIGGGTLSGPSPVAPNSQQTYTYESGLLVWSSSWVITGGTLVSSSMVPNEVGDPTYQVVVLWGSAGSGTVTFKKGFTTLGSLAVTIASVAPPAVPLAPTITNNCNSTRLTRGNPPGAEVWYWQSSATGTVTTNAAQYVDRTSGTVYYLRAYNSTTSQWSTANTINYTITQDACSLSNENYVLTIIPRIASTNVSGLTIDQKIESIAYFDGIGRPVQTIAIRSGGTFEDIVIHIEYDNIGRKSKEYLPYAASSNGGNYRATSFSDTEGFYDTAKYQNTSNSFSELVYEASRLNRVLEQMAPGNDWQKGITIDANGHSNGNSIKYMYKSNTVTDVKRYIVTTAVSGNTYTPTLTLNANYAVDQLYKTITKDENWKTIDNLNRTTEEFKDKQGRVILKRAYNNNQKHDTYYVYDTYGNLTYVLPPKSEADVDIPNAAELAALCYQYVYDNLNRLIEKKIPGKDWEYIIYDNLNRPVLTQDGNQRSKSPDQWLFTKYDGLGRVIYTGIYESNSLRSTLQINNFDTKTTTQNYESKVTTLTGFENTYYTNTNFPVNDIDILTVNYYDNYYFNTGGNGNTVTTYYGVSSTTNAKGLPTGSRIKVLETTDTWITTVSYYDEKARPIYSYSKNDLLGTIDFVESNLDSFTGRVEETKTTHKKTGESDIVSIDKFTYDHMGRVSKQTNKINTQAEELISENVYDELGQLAGKNVGNIESAPLQNVSYTYNVRGWLKNINQDLDNDNDLFNFTIMYNDIANTTKKLYNGNISKTSWNTLSDNTTGNPISIEYTYTYDALNRITSAIDDTGNYNLDLVQYDKNGNITALNRKGHSNTGATLFGNMDLLVYGYETNSNKLKKVTDTSGKIQGFKDGANLATEYTYDVNGNMKTDANKGITSILYNHLNLPTEVKFNNSNTKKINYSYDATGIKIRKVVNDNGSITTADYASNGAVYENNVLQFIPTAEGYITPNGNFWKYIYNYTDHLGNVRLSYSDNDGDGHIDVEGIGQDLDNDGVAQENEIIEENHYYPFGLKHKGYNNVVTSTNPAQDYKYNGIELEESLDLNLYEMDMRQYDPAIGRWTSIDPITHHSMSTYTAFDNNPVYWADPSGADAVYNWDDEKYYDNGKEVSFEDALASYGLNIDGTSQQQQQKKKSKAEKSRDKYVSMIIDARGDGYNVAADNLQRWLDGTGGTKNIDSRWLKSFRAVRSAEEKNIKRFEKQLAKLARGLSDGQTITFTDYWDAALSGSTFTELFYASGKSQITSTGSFTLTRKGNKVYVSGSINHEWNDPYDWHAGLSAEIPGFGNIKDEDALLVEQVYGAKPFHMTSRWSNSVSTSSRLWFLGSYISIDLD